MSVEADDHAPALTATEWLVSPYLERAVARVGYQYGLPTTDLQDLIQEVKIATWQAGPDVKLSASWIFQVASFKAVDSVRRQIRRRNQDHALAAALAPVEHDEELEHLLHARVTTLPARLRKFYDLRYRLGLTEREIARRLGVCRASVRWLNRSLNGRMADTRIKSRSHS